jgi:beta-glucanase (GH16 family)
MKPARAWTMFVATAALVAAGCTNSPASEAAMRTRASVKVSTTHPIKHEAFTVKGHLSTHFRRVVDLRMHSASGWKTVHRAHTNSSGGYRFTMSAASTHYFKVAASAVRHSGHRYTKASSSTTKVVPVVQHAYVDVLPQVAQQGTGVASSSTAKAAVVARFSPARPGRRVHIKRQQPDGSWVVVAAGTQDSGGRMTYSGSPSSAAFEATTGSRSGAPSVTSSVGRAAWSLRFDDEFNGTALDTSKWALRSLGTYVTSRQLSTNSAKAVHVGGGALQLQVLKNTAGNCPAKSKSTYGCLLNGQVSTQDATGSFKTFKYGVASARMKFPTGRGQHGSFWLKSPLYGTVPGDPARSGAEIDAIEFFGKGYPKGGLANQLYYRTKSGLDKKFGSVWSAAEHLKPAGDAWWTSYHVFTLKWTPSAYTFYVDGRVLWQSHDAVSRTGEYLVLSMLTSDWEVPQLDRSTLPTTMYVDWAKVWQSNG